MLINLGKSYRGGPPARRSVPSKQDTSKEQTRVVPDEEAEGEDESPIEIVIFEKLKEAYPHLRAEALRWRDASTGMNHIIVPIDFWNNLSKEDRNQFARELDVVFKSHIWVVDIGRYDDQGKVETETSYLRAAFLDDATKVKPKTTIFDALKVRYPELSGDKLFWRDVAGKLYIAVPDPFWDALSAAEKRQLARELDNHFNTHNWIVTTGRYMGRGKMMLDVHHLRRELVNASNG